VVWQHGHHRMGGVHVGLTFSSPCCSAGALELGLVSDVALELLLPLSRTLSSSPGLFLPGLEPWSARPSLLVALMVASASLTSARATSSSPPPPPLPALSVITHPPDHRLPGVSRRSPSFSPSEQERMTGYARKTGMTAGHYDSEYPPDHPVWGCDFRRLTGSRSSGAGTEGRGEDSAHDTIQDTEQF